MEQIVERESDAHLRNVGGNFIKAMSSNTSPLVTTYEVSDEAVSAMFLVCTRIGGDGAGEKAPLMS